MNTQPWSFAVNPFLTATNGSYANTQRLNHFHLAALNTAQPSDVFFANMYNTYKPLHDDLNDAFILKNNEQNKTGIHSAACDAARTALCIQEYMNLGSLMTKFYQTPDAVATYFDLMNIRTHQQTDFTHLVKPVHVFTI